MQPKDPADIPELERRLMASFLEVRLAALFDRGDVSVYYGQLPAESQCSDKKWSVSWGHRGYVGIAIADSLAEAVANAFRESERLVSDAT
jgi:hypothetical protein